MFFSVSFSENHIFSPKIENHKKLAKKNLSISFFALALQ